MTKRRRKQQSGGANGLLLAVILTILIVAGLFFAMVASPRSRQSSAPATVATGRQTPRPRPTVRPTPTVVRAQQSQSSGGQSSATNRCPSNCTQAKEMGVSAERAAACGLDRDGDGVACYGD